jgi:hypothetical protein
MSGCLRIRRPDVPEYALIVFNSKLAYSFQTNTLSQKGMMSMDFKLSVIGQQLDACFMFGALAIWALPA